MYDMPWLAVRLTCFSKSFVDVAVFVNTAISSETCSLLLVPYYFVLFFSRASHDESLCGLPWRP